MRSAIRVHDGGHGEWSVVDLRRGYRICNFHEEGAQSHLHVPEDGPIVLRVPFSSSSEAESFVRIHANALSPFDVGTFRRKVNEWRSASKND